MTCRACFGGEPELTASSWAAHFAQILLSTQGLLMSRDLAYACFHKRSQQASPASLSYADPDVSLSQYRERPVYQKLVSNTSSCALGIA